MQYANKLLVQIDGRAIYTPLFAGVYWDQNRVLLKDVERIEIIRGPGGTVWGANAVNGIINITTKNSADTQGFYAEIGGGDEHRCCDGGAAHQPGKRAQQPQGVGGLGSGAGGGSQG